jgi:hypothetical protein
MTVHELKCWPKFFQHIITGTKRFEVRKNDRNFKVEDWLELREWNPVTHMYTGKVHIRQIKYILTTEDLSLGVDPVLFAHEILHSDYVILGF